MHDYKIVNFSWLIQKQRIKQHLTDNLYAKIILNLVKGYYKNWCAIIEY